MSQPNSELHLQPLYIENHHHGQALLNEFLTSIPSPSATIAEVRTWLGLWLQAVGAACNFDEDLIAIIRRFLLNKESMHVISGLYASQVHYHSRHWKDDLTKDVMIIRAREIVRLEALEKEEKNRDK